MERFSPSLWPWLAMALMAAMQCVPPLVISAHAYVDTAPQGFRFRNGITGETHPNTIPPCSPGGVYFNQYNGEYQNLQPSSKTYYDTNRFGHQIGICFGGISDSEYMFVDRYCPDGAVRFHVNSSYYACRYFEDCPDNQTRSAATGQCEVSLKNQSATDCISTSHPVNVGTGGKWLIEQDRVADRPNGQIFKRFYSYYRSAGDIDSPMGVNWRHTYQRSLDLDLSTMLTLNAKRPDGKVYRFTYTQTYWREDGTGYDYGEPQWLPEDDIEDRLIRLDASHAVPNGWQYTSASNVTEIYDAGGTLVSITSLDAYTQTLTYDANQRLERVDTSTGEFLLFAYDTNGRVSRVTDHAGRSWGYRYDAVGNLEFVDNPDLTTRRYHYNEQALTNNTDLAHALTGITDERALSDQPHQRYATYGYDFEGRAELSTLAGNAERVDIQYANGGVRTVTNSRGLASTYTTDFNLGLARLSQVSGAGCSACGVDGDATYQYDAVNNLIGRGENDRVTRFGNYDDTGQYGCKVEGLSPTDTTPNGGDCAFDPVASPDARRTDYTYDDRFFNKITSITEPSVFAGTSKETTYTYDDFGNRRSETINGFEPNGNPVSRTTTWQYNGPLHQLSQVDGPRTDVSDITTYRYYADDAQEGYNRARLKEIEDATGVLIRSNILYSATGKVLSETRPNGLTLTYTYYSGNDRLATLTESDGSSTRTTHWTYLATGEVKSITTGFGSSAATALTFGYDNARRLTRITDGLGHYIQYTLDTEGNRQEEKTHDSAGLLKKQLSQTFDLYNRLDVSSQSNEIADYDFAPDGTLDKTIDGQGSVTDYSYDAFKRLTEVTQDLGGTDPTTANATTVYNYDAQDRLSSVTDPINGSTTYAYDDLGNLVSQTSPDTGTTSFGYDGAGNLTQKIDAKGQAFTFSYDALNRLTGVITPSTANDIAYTYDTCANGESRLCSVTQAGVVADYAYTAFGDISAHQGVSYAYDAAGRVQSLIYPSGAILSNIYDAAGQVERVELSVGGTTTVLASSIQYQPFGPVSNLTYGNGLVLNQSLDTAYRLTDITAGSALSLTGAQYDELGNLTGRTDDGTTTIWGYDALSRLDVANGLFGSRDYDYDKNGNRSQLITDGQTIGYSYEPGSNRLASETGWTYTRDANGNTNEQLAADGIGRLYAYTSHNRLATVTDRTITLQGKGKNKTEVITDTELASYAYNGLGQRVSKTIDGTARHYVYGTGGELLAELDETGSPLRDYLYLNGQPLALLANTVNPGGDGAEIVMDNGDGGTGGTGSWTLKSSNKDYGTDYLLANGGTGSTYRWTPTLAPGTYAVYAWWVSHNSHSENVPYTLVHNGVTEQIVQDQSRNGGRWVLLGSYKFAGDGTDYIEVSDANGKTSADAVRFVEQLPPQVQTEVYYIHNDHLGAPQAMTDNTATAVWRADYDPFGQVTVNEDVDGNGTAVTLNVRFPGQYYDQETGLHYNWFRYYDPITGRYMTSDPTGLAGGLNTYLYANGNPLVFYDPDGLAPQCNKSPKPPYDPDDPDCYNKCYQDEVSLCSYTPALTLPCVFGGGLPGVAVCALAGSTALYITCRYGSNKACEARCSP